MSRVVLYKYHVITIVLKIIYGESTGLSQFRKKSEYQYFMAALSFTIGLIIISF